MLVNRVESLIRQAAGMEAVSENNWRDPISSPLLLSIAVITANSSSLTVMLLSHIFRHIPLFSKGETYISTIYARVCKLNAKNSFQTLQHQASMSSLKFANMNALIVRRFLPHIMNSVSTFVSTFVWMN